jgi:hypothetical protein
LLSLLYSPGVTWPPRRLGGEAFEVRSPKDPVGSDADSGKLAVRYELPNAIRGDSEEGRCFGCPDELGLARGHPADARYTSLRPRADRFDTSRKAVSTATPEAGTLGPVRLDEFAAAFDKLQRERESLEASYADLKARFVELTEKARTGESERPAPEVEALVRQLVALVETEREQSLLAIRLMGELAEAARVLGEES